MVDKPNSDDGQPGDADQVGRQSDPGRSDPMGVVLRLPSGRVRATPAAAPVEPATVDLATVDVATHEAAEPAGRSLDRDPGPDPTDVTLWPGVGTDPPGDFGGIVDSSRGSQAEHPTHPAEATERADWPWVEEWRAGNEPTPWATGLVLAVFSALVVGVAVWVLAAGLSDRPVVAVLVNLLVAGGLAPAIWLSRRLPVLRWVGAGAAAGIVIGWMCALLMLPLPAP